MKSQEVKYGMTHFSSDVMMMCHGLVIVSHLLKPELVNLRIEFELPVV